jgi:hypothetical protein
MLSVAYEPAKGVVVLYFSGALVPADFIQLDASLRQLRKTASIRGMIADFTGAERFDVSIDQVKMWASRKQVLPGIPKVLVAPRDLAYGMLRIFAVYREAAGGGEPMLVRDRASGFSHFEIAEETLESVA